jgi:hypothetical protein
MAITLLHTQYATGATQAPRFAALPIATLPGP